MACLVKCPAPDADLHGRCPLRGEEPPADTFVRPRRGRRARSRHRRQHRDLQHPERRAAAPPAFSGARPCRAALPCAAAGHLPGDRAVLALARELLRLAARRPILRGDGHVPRPVLHPHRPGHTETGPRRRGGRGFLRHPERAPGAGPHVPGGRRHARLPGGDRQRPVLAVAPGRGARRPGTLAEAERRGLHRRRRHARRVLRRFLVRDLPRDLGPSRPHRRRARGAREPQPAGRRAPAAGRGRRAGDVRARGDREAARAGLPAGQRGLGRHRGPAPRRDRARFPDDAGGAAGRGGARAPHRLRERREPALHAGPRTPQGDRDPGRPRGQPRPRPPAAADGGGRAGPPRRGGRPSPRPHGPRRGGLAPGRPGPSRRRDPRGRPRAALRARRLDPDRAPRRHRARPPRRTRGPDRCPEGGRTRRRGSGHPYAAPAGRGRSGAFGRAPHGSGGDAAQPARPAHRRRGVRSQRRLDHERQPAGDPI